MRLVLHVNNDEINTLANCYAEKNPENTFEENRELAVDNFKRTYMNRTNEPEMKIDNSFIEIITSEEVIRAAVVAVVTTAATVLTRVVLDKIFEK